MHEGDGLPGFPSVDVFIYLINPQLERLRDPALELIQDTYQQLEQLASQIVDKIFQRFPTLISSTLLDIMDQLHQSSGQRCRHAAFRSNTVDGCDLRIDFRAALSDREVAPHAAVTLCGCPVEPDQCVEALGRGHGRRLRSERSRVESVESLWAHPA